MAANIFDLVLVTDETIEQLGGRLGDGCVGETTIDLLTRLGDGRCRYRINFSIAEDARIILGEGVQVVAAE